MLSNGILGLVGLAACAIGVGAPLHAGSFSDRADARVGLGFAAATTAPAKGRLLIATRSIHGPPFGESVVLILHYQSEGAIGLILNRPLPISVAELLPKVDEVAGRSDRAHFGGPVEPNRVWILLRSASVPEASEALGGDLYATTSLETLRAIAGTGGSDRRYRAYVGYAGWAPGQLDAEIARGDWLVDSRDPGAVFEIDPSELWPDLIERNSGIQVRLRPPQVPASPWEAR